MESLLKEGIELFNRGAYFECHEVLELAWTPERGPRRLFLQGLIHVAVALHHHRRGNQVGAVRQLNKALRKLADYLPVYEDVDTGRLFREASAILAAIDQGQAVPEYPRMWLCESSTV